MKARAVHFVAPGKVEVRPVELPEVTGDSVLVATEYSGISSGTELLAYRGEVDPSLPLDETIGALAGTFTYPFRYGYAAVGRVLRAAGARRVGERVFAFHPHQDLFVTSAGAVFPVGGLGAREATMYPLVETALQVCLDAAPLLGETVVVIGQGTVGILVAALLGRTGADVLASEPRADRRRTAEAFGVHAVAPDHVADLVRARTAGRGADLVVEASGNPAALADGLALLAHEGTALVCSWYGTRTAPLPLGAGFHRRRLVIRSTQVSTLPAALTARWDRRRRAGAAWRWMGELPLGKLITHEFPLDRVAEAYERVDRGESGLVHAVLRYGDDTAAWEVDAG